MLARTTRATRSTRGPVPGQIALLPQPAVAGTPSRVLVVGVEDALVQRQSIPQRLVRVGVDLGIRYLAESELQAASISPSFWIADLPSSCPGRRVLFETITNHVVEQDDTGAMWIDDDPLGPGALVGFGCPARSHEDELILGERAALLVGDRTPSGWNLRVVSTTAVMWVFDRPRLADCPPLPGWLRLAVSDPGVTTARVP